jgi:hypothetical protein
MKRALFVILALALMALRPAQAQETGWQADCRRDRITKEFDPKDDQADIMIINAGEKKANPDKTFVAIPLDKTARAELERALREFKKCDKFYKCLEDRDTGKVKHCYEKDRRWR